MILSKKILGALGLLIVAGGGAVAAGIIEKPQYGLEDRGDWGAVTENSINITSQGYVHNPNSFGVNISGLDIAYRVKMNDVELAEGFKDGLNIAAEDNNTVEVETTLKPEKVPDWWVRHLRNDEVSQLEVPLTIDYRILNRSITLDGISYSDSIETDLESKMDQAIGQVQGTYSWSPTGAEISETEIEIVDGSAEFGRVTREKTPLLVTLNVRNPNSYPIPVPQFNGELNMNSIEIAKWQANEVAVTSAPENGMIAPGENQEVKLRVDMSNEDIDDWFVSHASRDEQTSGEINLRLGFDIAGQTFQIPRNGGLSCGFSFQTGILVDDQETASEFTGCEEESLGLGFGVSDNDSGSDSGSDGLLGDDDSSNGSNDSGSLTDAIL
jgi:LEA14-like dessication related protein